MINYCPRWHEDEDGTLKPLISRVHVIPLEESKTLLHCAQVTCWCSPAPAAESNQIIFNHNSQTSAQDWVLIGELDTQSTE